MVSTLFMVDTSCHPGTQLHRCVKISAFNEKTRPGGQPDGSSHMGAWGGWALAPNTANGEGITAPHALVAEGVPHVQTTGQIFRVSGGNFRRENSAGLA